MEVVRIFKNKTLTVCIGFLFAGVTVGYASSLFRYDMRCGSLRKTETNGIVLNARNRLMERKKVLRSKRNKLPARIRKERSKINKRMKNFRTVRFVGK